MKDGIDLRPVTLLLVRRLAAAWQARTTAAVFCCAALMLLTFAISFYRLEASSAAIQVDNCILGADSATYLDSLAKQHYLGLRLHKHALAVVAVAGVAQPLVWIGVPPLSAALAALAVIQATAAGLLFAFLRRNVMGDVGAVALTLLTLSLFGTATLFGIVETYSVTLAAIALASLLYGELAALARFLPMSAGLAAGIIGALMGWANPPAVAFVLLYTSLAWRHVNRGWPSKLMTTLVIPAMLASALTFIVTVAFAPGESADWQGRFIDGYASLANFADARVVKDYLASFFVYSLVAPLPHLQCRFPANALAAMLSDPLRTAALVLTALLVIVGVIRGLKSSHRNLTLAALGVVGSLFIFYLYFNPDEALLYSPQWTLAMLIAAAPGLRSERLGSFLIAPVSLLCSAANLPPLHHSRSTDPAFCCPNPPATMIDRTVPCRLLERGKVWDRTHARFLTR